MSKKTFGEIIKAKANEGYASGVSKSEANIVQINIAANALMMLASLVGCVGFFLYGPDSMIMKFILIALSLMVTISSFGQVMTWMRTNKGRKEPDQRANDDN